MWPAGIIISAFTVFHSQIMWFVRIHYLDLVTSCDMLTIMYYPPRCVGVSNSQPNSGINVELSLAFKKLSITAGEMENQVFKLLNETTCTILSPRR